MNMSLAEKLKELRKHKNVSQEKLAEYLGVSYQAVSKWENGITSPDISLLPAISRYFGITVDELLQAEQIDEKAYFEDCCCRAEELFRNGKRAEIIPIWLEAYKKMPNNAAVKEMLMSTYFDCDKVKYQKEIIEIGTKLYHMGHDDLLATYYKGQAIEQISRTYYENGNPEKAKEWVQKAYSIMHAQEMMYMQVEDNEKWLVGDFRFANHWYLDKLFYMAIRMREVGVKDCGDGYVQKVSQTIANILEIVYPNDDMGYETLRNLYNLHLCIAEDETALGNDETTVKKHLTRAAQCALKSVGVQAHELTHPLVYGWQVADAPTDNKQLVRFLTDEVTLDCYQQYRDKDWFVDLKAKLEKAL